MAWFVAQDTATAKAYAKERPRDRYPLTVTPESWLLFVSVMAPTEADTLADRVAAIGEAVRRGSFLSVASSYPVDDALRMMKLLTATEAGGVSLEDLREGVQLDFNRLLEHAEELRVDPTHLALEVAQRNLKRNDHRASRTRKEAAEQSALLSEDRADLAAERAATRREVEAALAAKAEAEEETRRVQEQSKRRTHRLAVLMSLLVVVMTIGFTLGWGFFTEPFWAPAFLTAAGVVVLWDRLNTYVREPETPRIDFVRRSVVGVAVYVLSLTVSRIVDGILTGR